MDSSSGELSPGPEHTSRNDESISSGLASSGFGSEGFGSESFDKSESELDTQPYPPYKRRRRSLWQETMPIKAKCHASEKTSSLNSAIGSDEPRPPTPHENNSPLPSSTQSAVPKIVEDSDYPGFSAEQPFSAESQLSNSTQNLRDILFDIHGVISSKDMAKEQEAISLSDILEIVEEGGLSEQRIRALFKTRRVRSFFSYDVLISYLDRRSKVSKHYSLMCPLEHMAKQGPNAEGSVCSSQNCTLNIVKSHKFWYRYVSDMIAALFRERDSFDQLINGCRRAKRAVTENEMDNFYDFYDGALFRRKYARYLRTWNEEHGLYIFLTFSSDGFEEIGGHRGPRTAWPLIFIVLNFERCHRFKAGNALLAGFVPGTHDNKFFDTFLEPIVTDLSMLEGGCILTCADGKLRKLRVFVMFITADYPAASARALLPSGGAEQRSKAISSSRTTNDYEWLDLECLIPRTDRQTRDTWRQLDAIPTNNATNLPRAKKSLRTSTGISRRPVLGRLKIDFVHSLPYDPMHLVFLGWVKHLLRLLFGLHEKTTCQSTYVIPQTKRNEMNQSLTAGGAGVPGCWGRASESLDHIATFKAEDFKNFGMFYAPILFSRHGLPQRISRLWGVTSKIVHIICDPSPALADVEEMRQFLQEAHALFSAHFHLDERHAFCFTPNTHAILHLADMLRECGPLPNVSQFIVERLIGEIGEMIGSMARPEASLFHKTHTLFSYRLLSEGMTNLEDSTNCSYNEDFTSNSDYGSDDEISQEDNGSFRRSSCAVLGSGKKNLSPSKTAQAQKWLRKKLGEDVQVGILGFWCHSRARVEPSSGKVVFETETSFLNRERKAAYKVRQKFWIAGHFHERYIGDSQHNVDTDASNQSVTGVYYGRVTEILNVRALITSTTESTAQEKRFVLITVDWQYGISIDRFTGMMSVRNGKGPRRGSVRHVERTIEEIGCVNRLIGFFDYGGRKYFMDPQRWRIVSSRDMMFRGLLQCF